MNDKKGFTLAELLGVIILLGIISATIAVPILSQINKTTSKVNKATENILYTSTGLYMAKYSSTYKKVNENIYYITLEQLINSGVLESDFLTKNAAKDLTKETQIKVTVRNKSFHYEIPNTMLDSILKKYNNIETTNYSYVDGTYIKGTYDNNYVLYNGFIWRIMGKNKDNTIRLVMDENASTLMYYNNVDYKTSYIRDWLNDYFISRLQYNDIIAKEKWYYKASTSINNTIPNTDTYVEDKVGLISLEEFNLSLSGGLGFLKDKCYGLLNQSDAIFYSTCDNQMPKVTANDLPLAIKPIINVYGSIIVSDGDGTISNPYVLADYKVPKTNLTLADANLSVGEYIQIDGKNYRVIEKDQDDIKIMSYHPPTLFFTYAPLNYLFNLNDGSGLRLNKNVISGKFLKRNIFIGKIYGMGDNYKNTVFSKVNIVYDVFSALPSMGEMLTSNLYHIDDDFNYWTLNIADINFGYQICPDGHVIKINTNRYDESEKYKYSLLYTSYISLGNVIISGNGTQASPYVI